MAADGFSGCLTVAFGGLVAAFFVCFLFAELGQDKVHFQAVGLHVFGDEFAVVLLGNVFGNCQPQACARGAATARV